MLEVAWSLSRTGTITPVAQVEPVVLSGATVTRATLHNLSTVERLRLRRGDRLLLTRRGGVIPHVEASIGGGDEAVAPPAACPGCGGPTEVHETTRKVAGAALTTRTLHCAAPETCPPVLRGQLVHFATTLEIDGFGPKVVDALVEQGLVRDEADLFALDEATMLRLPRMGPTLARRLLSQRDARREVTLATLLVALGVESLGRQTADLLASRWSLAELRAVSEDAIADLHSLDTLTAARIVTGLRAAGPRLDRLLHEVRVTQGAATQAGVLAGHTVVFTGRLEQMGRRDAQQWVTRRGGIAGASVTAETTLLVVGGDELSAATPSSKLVKARKLSTATGLEIVDEPTFFSRFGGSDA